MKKGKNTRELCSSTWQLTNEAVDGYIVIIYAQVIYTINLNRVYYISIGIRVKCIWALHNWSSWIITTKKKKTIINYYLY